MHTYIYKAFYPGMPDQVRYKIIIKEYVTFPNINSKLYIAVVYTIAIWRLK